jgi:hypothetical protein
MNKSNLHIKLLTGTTAEKIHEVFIDAFSEYDWTFPDFSNRFSFWE